MLSLTRCRELLPVSEAEISDAELDRLRHQLYEMAHMVLDVIVVDRRQAAPGASSMTTLDSDPAGAYDPGGDK